MGGTVRIVRLLVAAAAVTAFPLDLAAQSGGYRTTQNGRELASEFFRWTGRTLEATADVPLAGHRVVTRTTYDAAYEPLAYELRVLALATGEEQQVVHVTFSDSVRWSVEGRPTSGARALPAPRAVMQNLLWSHLAAMVRRLPPSGDTSLTLHAFLADNSMAIDLALARHAGRVTVLVAGTEVVLVPSADGDLASASVPSQGLLIERVPAERVSASKPLEHHGPAPLPAGVAEEPYAWSDGPQRLAGTLALPEPKSGPVPVVLIIAGSGPTDRDGNNPLGVRSDVYKKLAWALARRGIASVRYDKRGIGASAFMGDASSVTFEDFTDDAREGALALAADRRFQGVVLVGHSEGALLATHATNRGAPVAGVVMLAGMGRPIGVLLGEQLARQMDSADVAAFQRALGLFLGSGPMPEVRPEWRAILPRSVRRFLQSENVLDPADEARRVPVPLMVVQGATDIQVSVRDAEAIRAARPSAEVHILPEASHMFVHAASADPAAQAPGYTDPSAPLVPDLVPLVADFVLKVVRPLSPAPGSGRP
jgi:alpha-beta hydrolase superfamily lysophospholipase